MRTQGRVVVVAIVLAAAPSAAQLQPQASPSSQSTRDAVNARRGLIEGRVLAGDTGAALRRVRLVLSGAALSEQRVANTDSQGRYRFDDVPPGRYGLTASRNGYLRLSFGQRRPNGLGKPVQLSPGQRLQNVDFALPRMSVLSGIVTDETGQPLEGCNVTALRSRMTADGRQFSPAAVGITDASGFFRLLSLMPGEYWLRATSSETWTLNNNGQSDTQSYSPTYYPGSVGADGARPVRVPLGEEVADVDIALVPGHPVSISGTVLNSRGESLGGRALQLVERTFAGSNGTRGGLIRSSQSTIVSADGSFRFKGVPNGSYNLEVNLPPDAGHPAEAASVAILVSDADLSNVFVATSSGAEAHGTIETESTSLTRFSTTSLRVIARTKPPTIASLAVDADNGKVQEDLTFAIRGILGPSAFTLARLPEGWFVTHVYLGQREITDVFIEPREILLPIRIVISDRVTRLSGTVLSTVLSSKENAQEDCTVLIFPTDESQWGLESRLIRAVRTDQNHQFSIGNMPPSEYYVAALPDIDQDQWFDVSFLQETKLYAERIRLNENEKKIVTLKPIGETR